MDLVAELLLGANYVRPEFFSSEEFAADHAEVFSKLTGLSLKPIGDILDSQYKNGGSYPQNTDVLRRVLFEAGVDFDQLRDPWGTPYSKVFSIDKDDSVLEVVSAGPDKIFTTKDDFTVNRITRPYFRFTGEAIDRAVARFHARTGGFIRDAATLKNELQSEGIDFASLRDPWGQPYDLTFTTSQNRFNLNVRSGGPNKRFRVQTRNPMTSRSGLRASITCAETRALVEQALRNYFRATQCCFPRTTLSCSARLRPIDQSKLQDPWGNRYYAVYKVTTRYSDRTVASKLRDLWPTTESAYRNNSGHTSKSLLSTLRSNGRGRQRRNRGRLRRRQRFRSQRRKNRVTCRTCHCPHFNRSFFSGAKGAIKGTVTDANGASNHGRQSEGYPEELDRRSSKPRLTIREGFCCETCRSVFTPCVATRRILSPTVITEVPVSSSNITTVDSRCSSGRSAKR